ncbi:MAG: hypothetical protein NT030_07695 [Candidatus Saganbacteria bacterium]|nr:hypothetical protein [Candidatus Saganbacteria bacterium]
MPIRYMYKVGDKKIDFGRKPVYYGFKRARREGQVPEIDLNALKEFKGDLKTSYSRLQNELNLTEREICLAEKEQKKRVVGPNPTRDGQTLLELPEVYRQSFNATLTLSLLTFLTYGRILYKGPAGFGKTTTAEEWGKAIYGIPLNWIQAATIYGNDKLTEEMVIARFDIGQLTQGTEIVQERLFALLPFRMIDELNRIPSHILSLFYQLVDRTLHVYGNIHLEIPAGSLFATINERAQDTRQSGNFPIPRPFYDRFDVSVVVPGLNPLNFHSLLSKTLLEGAKPKKEILNETKQKIISYEELKEHPKMWNAKRKIERAQEEIQKVHFPGFFPDPKNKFHGTLSFNDGELVAKVEYFLSQFFYCTKMADKYDLFWGNKAFRQKIDFKNELCGKENDCIGKNKICELTDNYQASMRALQSIIKYSSAFAWYLENDSVIGKEINIKEKMVEELLPFIMAHRLYLEGSDEDKQAESQKHEDIRSMWKNSMTNYEKEETKGIIQRYYEERESLEKEVNETGKIDLNDKEKQNRLSKLLKDIDSQLKDDPARIPMAINLQQLIGDFGLKSENGII